MAIDYLSKNGLSYFWSKLKAWALATFALTVHNQSSNTINAMTGYSKPSSGSAISVNDSLNSAVGKLEAKVDAVDQSNVVHITGTEVITGEKSFRNFIKLYKDSLLKGVIPNSTQYMGIALVDRNLFDRFGLFETSVNNQGDVITYITSYKNEANSSVTSALGVVYLADGTKYGFAPDTPTTRNDATDIVTRGFIPNDTRIVHTSGGEIIAGEKTFTSSLKIKRNNPYINFVETDITNFTDGDSTPYQGLYFRDKNEDIYAALIGQTYANQSHIDIYVYDKNGDYSLFRFYRKPDGTEAFASFPTPAANATGTQVVTAEWVNAKGYLTSHQSLANYVTLNGNQTITGGKTFTQSIIVQRSNPYTIFVETDIEKGTADADSGGTGYQGLYFEDKNRNVVGAIIGNPYGGSTHKNYYVTLRARDFRTAAATDEVIVGCEYGETGVKSFRPEPSNDVLLGTGGRRWKEIWCNQSSINTSSDERIKDFISDIPDEVLDAWGDVHWRQFKYKDAIAEKGAAARLHSGAVAQEVDRAFHAHNLDVSGYGLFLHDSWEAVEETRDDRGSILSYASPAGDEYGLRYVEALCMEAAYQRRENTRLKKRVADLEERLAALELKIA